MWGSFWGDENVLKLTVMVAALLGEYTNNHGTGHIKMVNCMVNELYLSKAVAKMSRLKYLMKFKNLCSKNFNVSSRVLRGGIIIPFIRKTRNQAQRESVTQAHTASYVVQLQSGAQASGLQTLSRPSHWGAQRGAQLTLEQCGGYGCQPSTRVKTPA